MNLADIRKKAQQEKAELQPAPTAPEETACQYSEKSDAPFDDLISTEEAPTHLSPAMRDLLAEEEPASIGFDPLSVLMAGRDSGCGEEEMPLASSVLPERGGDEFQEFLYFRVADEKYAVNIMDIKEIIKPREVTEVPRAPASVSGILSLRGIIIPVFDLRKRLGLADAGETGKERIIVVKKEKEFCGMLVDEVIQVVRISSFTIEPPPAVLDGIDRDFVNGIGRYDKQMLILLNLEKILDVTLH